MFPDVGLAELLLIGVMVLVLGRPEDVPEVMRRAGVMTAFVRSWMHGMWQGWQEPMAEQRQTTEHDKHKPI